ncbi:MAG: hypothetical protein Q8L34_06285, partial [Candidatus Woesearchaeota archaeon]|nr:hypothetical protein [Candidatus Woesearchaeota archaeon]
AAIVTMWVKDRAESSTQAQIDQAEQELRCAETTLNVAVDCITPTNDITVTNTGKFTLKKVKFRQLDPTSGQTNIEDISFPSALPNGLPPQQTETLNTNTIDTLLAFEAIPIIALNEKEVVCVTKKVIHVCP